MTQRPVYVISEVNEYIGRGVVSGDTIRIEPASTRLVGQISVHKN